MSIGTPTEIINLTAHSFTVTSDKTSKKGRRFSNVNTQAVIYNNEELDQLYTGLYLDKNLHNIGTYRWQSDSGTHEYEGKFFLNHLHGYGKLAYPNDVLFEGLFYFNKKFGPGVVTYKNQNQDVGLWNGNFLIRLCDKFSTSDFYKEHIPKLSGLMESKLYLLQFKHLIPIAEKFNDPAVDILKEFEAPDDILAKKHLLYSKCIRNSNSMFCNSEKLYKNFFTYVDELHTTVDVVDHFDEDGKPVITKLDVCNLVAWNNEEINVAILKHAFLNRHYEKLLSYKIKDVLCTNKRGDFLPPGPIETKSRELLFACRSNDSTPVRRLITENDLYPDVADCKGNNTVTYATLANQIEVIKVLSEFGANLNNFNDDGITPLMFAILQYISIKYDVSSLLWEPAFIYKKMTNDLPPCNQQWPTKSASSNSCISLINYYQSSQKLDMDNSVNNIQIPNIREQERRDSFTSLLKEYVLSLDCLNSKRTINIRETINIRGTIIDSDIKLKRSSMNIKFKKSNTDLKSKKSNTDLNSKKSNTDLKSKKSNTDLNSKKSNTDLNSKKSNTDLNSKKSNTDLKSKKSNTDLNSKKSNTDLKSKKSNTDIKSKKSSEHLDSVFTDDNYITEELEKISQIIQTLLLCGADPNIGEIPFCPIITSIFSRSTYLIQMLISFNAFVNAKTCEHFGNLGPLHVIASLSPCSEQQEMAFEFLENGAYVDAFTNKTHWIEEQHILLGGKLPHDYLEKTPLHVVCMRYDFPDDKDDYLIHLALMFIQYGANVNLKYLGHTSLTLAMMRGNIKLMGSLLETGLVDPNEGLEYNMGVPLTVCILNRYRKLIPTKVAEQIYPILMHFYANPFNDVPNFNGNAIEFYYHEESSKKQPINIPNINAYLLLNCAKTTLLKHIKSKVVQTLYLYKIIYNFDSPIFNIIAKYLNYENTLEILQILIDHEKIIENEFNIQKLLQFIMKKKPTRKIEFTKNDENYMKFHFNNYMPEIDPDELKYKVCFECFKKTNETLIICSKCKMVYFCSNECNIKNVNDRNSGHPCKGVFYDQEILRRKRSSKLNQSIDNSSILVSLANKNIEDFTGMSPKDRKKMKQKLKQLHEINGEDDAETDSESDAGSEQGKRKRKKAADKRKRKSSATSKKRSDKKSQEDKMTSKKGLLSGKSEKSSSKENTVKSRTRSSKSRKVKSDTSSSGKKSDKSKKSSRKYHDIGLERGDKISEKGSPKEKKSKVKSLKDLDKTMQKGKSEESKKSFKKKLSNRKSQKGTKIDKISRSDFGERKPYQINLPFGKRVLQDASSTKKDRLSLYVGSKNPAININKRNMYMILKNKMKERDRELNARKGSSVQSQRLQEKLQMKRYCTERMLQLARENYPNFPNDYKELDIKFWQTFTPYCLFQDGQLYYNFNDDSNDLFYKIAYR